MEMKKSISNFLNIIPFFFILLIRFAISYKLKNYHQLELPAEVFGPESIVFDCNGGGPYTGVSDGRILKWHGGKLGWKDFAVPSLNWKREVCDGSSDLNKEEICGRPLGLKFLNKAAKSCDLYIADAYYGLLMVGPNGGVAKQLATTADGVPFRFTNHLDIDTKSGVVYFTDTSAIYQRREFFLVIQTGEKSGRLMKYDLKTKNVTVLLKGLAFANGVALSKDKRFLLVAQTSLGNILKYWLKGPKAKTMEILAQFTGSLPDNIERNKNGDFWVALNNGGNTSDNKPQAAAVKVDGIGKVLEMVNEKVGRNVVLKYVSDVKEHNGSLWIGSVTMSCVGVFKT